MDEKRALTPQQIRDRLQDLQASAGHQATDPAPPAEAQITVAAQREAFDLKACKSLLAEHHIESQVQGRGFQQVLVVSRDESSHAMNLIAAHKLDLLRASPLTAGDYVVGIVAWSLGGGLVLPSLVAYLLTRYGAGFDQFLVGVPIAGFCGLLLGGSLGYLRCRAVASRRKR